MIRFYRTVRGISRVRHRAHLWGLLLVVHVPAPVYRRARVAPPRGAAPWVVVPIEP